MAALSIGCGASSVGTPASMDQQPSVAVSEQTVQQEAQFDGLLGALSQEEIRRGITRSESQFHRCIAEAVEHLELVEGTVILSFRVSTAGTVRRVYASRSDVGSRSLERCLVEVAHDCRFSRPVGGEVEFEWPIEFMAPEDLRPASPWSPARVARTRDANLHLLAACAEAPTQGVTAEVTVYVGPSGQVLSVGAASPRELPATTLDCISEHVASWGFPEPGSYPAKVTFELVQEGSR